jgi:serine/threonine-protein kinase
MPDGSPPSLSETGPIGSPEPTATINKAAIVPSILTGKDGAKLYLIPEGNLLLPGDMVKEPGKTVKINPFYMDETEVTNHQYAEFLNRVISKVRVEGEVVKADGSVWLLLGEAAKGYEPITFKDGKFMVKDPIYHSHPVVRVTALGAAAYGSHFGRRLPTATEWLYASRSENKTVQAASGDLPRQPDNSHMEMMSGQGQTPSSEDQVLSESPVSVTQSQPNQYGIRGLDGNVNEWGILVPSEPSRASKGRRYGVLPEAVERQPWEAFKNVGFRTVLPVSK